MSNGFSLINVNGKITEPVTTFINKISTAVGGYYRPRQIRRVAEAKADAEIIGAKAKIAVSDLERRAVARFISEEARKQENIESITEKAIPGLLDTSAPQDMDDDWIMNFFDKCRIISDSDMQLLWSKVLSGEANNPGSYSKRTVNLLGSLSIDDARMFTKVCSCILIITNIPQILIFDDSAAIYNDNGVTFGVLTHLDNIGLITFDFLSGYKRANIEQEIEISYFGTNLRLRFTKPENNELKVGKAVLMQSGVELFKVCNPKPLDGFVDYCIDNLSKQGITCTT